MAGLAGGVDSNGANQTNAIVSFTVVADSTVSAPAFIFVESYFRCSRTEGRGEVQKRRLPGLPYRSEQHEEGERTNGARRNFSDERVQQIHSRQTGLRRLPRRHQRPCSRESFSEAAVRFVSRYEDESHGGDRGIRHEHSRHEPQAWCVGSGKLLGLSRQTRNARCEEWSLASVQAEPPTHLRDVSHESRNYDGIQNEISGRGIAIQRQHPWPRSVEDGFDRGAFMQ